MGVRGKEGEEEGGEGGGSAPYLARRHAVEELCDLIKKFKGKEGNSSEKRKKGKFN